ncbi:hypothetical protein FOMPIDRAFT_1159610 [Fomitopsis schrenkii]|uniref:Uncharacterized protein n=1 Tax=Fomitopsis schrenkii TaxID=2126942 RepID=S8EI88_FOMSC|nr:hypothetical protein FOMPIDRAFT_1159610 [Fomitopsis schrenkii]
MSGSLVGVESIKAHLRLLATFKRLRQRVESSPSESLPDVAQFLDGPQRWAWFVGLAVERFQRWLKHVKWTEFATWVVNDIPPLDVLMMWHSYMLNPIWYAEDCDRIPALRTLQSLSAHFMPAVLLIAQMLIADFMQYEPCEQRGLSWFEKTNTPFDPFHSMKVLLHRTVRCPGCGRSNDVAFLDQDGIGYLQRNFCFICVCSLDITKSALALEKFANDLVTNHRYNVVEPEKSLAGTLHTPAKGRDWLRAVNAKGNLLGTPGGPFRPGISIYLIFIHRPYSRIMNAYADDRPFSIDLAAAVLRQGTFIDSMDDLGWTAPGFFDDEINEALLTHALARYHAFLDLLSIAPNAFYVPTLDIDIVWHTHQLTGSKYLEECKELVGWYVDHDDKVEETHLTQGLDETCKIWQQRFGLPYMHCGCPLPDAPRSSKFSLRRRPSSTKDADTALEPLSHPGAAAATHASEHDAVQMSATQMPPVKQHELEHRHQQRAQELRRRRERDGKRVLDGKMDEELYRRGFAHISSSSMPVPGAAVQARPDASERWAAPCVVSFPGAFGTTGVGTCVAGIKNVGIA